MIDWTPGTTNNVMSNGSCRRRQESNGRGIRKGNARIGAGLEGSFFPLGETSLFVLNPSCERGVEGRLQSEPMGA